MTKREKKYHKYHKRWRRYQEKAKLFFTSEKDDNDECPFCGNQLDNTGAGSDGDGDIYDMLVCPVCDYTEKVHASYCRCIDCSPYDAIWQDDDDDSSDPNDSRNL